MTIETGHQVFVGGNIYPRGSCGEILVSVNRDPGSAESISSARLSTGSTDQDYMGIIAIQSIDQIVPPL